MCEGTARDGSRPLLRFAGEPGEDRTLDRWIKSHKLLCSLECSDQPEGFGANWLCFADRVFEYPSLGYIIPISHTRYMAEEDSRRLLFCQRLVEARRWADMTQVQVARALGKHQSFISKCENGERRVDAFELAAFSRLYRKPMAWFVSED